jgi:hypothetical protein
MCIRYPTWIATPVESSIRIVHRRHNTITLLFEKQNIMLSIEFPTSGFHGPDAAHADREAGF